MIKDDHGSDRRVVPGLVQALAQQANLRLRYELEQHDMAVVRPLHAPLLLRLLNGARRASDLASAAGVSRQAMAQVLGGLERAGIVERIDDPGDSRAKLVCLTPAGRSALRLMRSANQTLEEEWRQRIGPDRLLALREAILDLL